MNKKKLIYILLIIAIFSAFLRPSQDSPITLFRLLLPICVYFFYKVNKEIGKRFVLAILVLLFLTLFQYYVTVTIIYPQIHSFSLLHLLSYGIHYFTVLTVMTLVYCLWFVDKSHFFLNIINFSSILIQFSLICYILHLLTGHDMATFPLFGNINNFGCALSGGILAIIFDSVTNKFFKWILVLLILYVLLYNDSKLAFFGGIIEIGLYAINCFVRKATPSFRKFALFFLAGISLMGIYKFVNSDIEINEYSIQSVVEIFEQMASGQFFDDSLQSITFRANSIIGISKILFDSYGIGVGAGNTAVILGYMLPQINEGFDDASVASHCWWYEVMADWGWLIIVPMIKIYFCQLRNYCKIESNEKYLFMQIFIISFPLWCMSASGLYTEFYSIMLIAVSLIVYKYKEFAYEKTK